MPNTTTAEQLQALRAMTKSGQARDIRRGARLSQGDISRSIGVDASTVARWETGQRTPRGEAALRYAHLLTRLSRASAAA